MLGEVPLFSGLDAKELRTIAGSGREVSFEPGKRILKQGEPGLSFLLVLEGKVKIQKNGKTVATTGPGGFFGEMTVFDDKPRTADVVAMEETRCFGLTNWSFLPLLRRDPGIAIEIIKELVRRLRLQDQKGTA
jgi:CRP-like cAMP-binding protein